jgi:hypothetical protein
LAKGSPSDGKKFFRKESEQISSDLIHAIERRRQQRDQDRAANGGSSAGFRVVNVLRFEDDGYNVMAGMVSFIMASTRDCETQAF